MPNANSCCELRSCLGSELGESLLRAFGTLTPCRDIENIAKPPDAFQPQLLLHACTKLVVHAKTLVAGVGHVPSSATISNDARADHDGERARYRPTLTAARLEGSVPPRPALSPPAYMGEYVSTSCRGNRSNRGRSASPQITASRNPPGSGS